MPPPNKADAAVDAAKVTGRRKAAAFMLSLDSEVAALLMQKLGERDVALLSEEMTRVGELTAKEAEDYQHEFNKLSGGERINAEPMLLEILERALGKEKARELLDKIRRQSREVEPFRSLLTLDSRQISTLLRGEHPQVVALILAHLDHVIASEVLRDMEEGMRYEVVRRIAATEDLSAELIRQVDEMMEVRAFSLGKRTHGGAVENRFKTVAQMLNVSEPSLSKNIIERLVKDAPTLANEIQALMFVFEDLTKIADKDIQKILGEVDKADLVLSLRAAPPEVKDKLLNNLSARARENMKDEMEMMGAKPLHEIEEAQKRILQKVRDMGEKGDIQISRGNTEKMV